MKVKKTLLLALLAGFVASILAVSGEAAVQKKKKKRKRATAEQRFKRMDKDKDGFLSKDEFISSQKGKRAKNAEKRWKRMEKFAKKDPKKGLTLEEYKKASTRKRKKKKKDNA